MWVDGCKPCAESLNSEGQVPNSWWQTPSLSRCAVTDNQSLRKLKGNRYHPKQSTDLCSFVSKLKAAACQVAPIQEHHRAFAHADKDGSGTVDMQEIGADRWNIWILDLQNVEFGGLLFGIDDRFLKVWCPLNSLSGLFFGWQELRDYLLSHGQSNQQKAEQVEELFALLDLDEDGIITKSEFQEGFNAFTKAKAHSISNEAGNMWDQILQPGHEKRFGFKGVVSGAFRNGSKCAEVHPVLSAQEGRVDISSATLGGCLGSSCGGFWSITYACYILLLVAYEQPSDKFCLCCGFSKTLDMLQQSSFKFITFVLYHNAISVFFSQIAICKDFNVGKRVGRTVGYELQKLREIFESVDTNGDGAISQKVTRFVKAVCFLQKTHTHRFCCFFVICFLIVLRPLYSLFFLF